MVGRPGARVAIHPWDRSSFDEPDSNVYLVVGDLRKGGDIRYHENPEDDSYTNVIVNRKEFVEGLLVVFPELRRVDS